METCRVEAAVCWNTLRAFTTHHQLVEVKTSKDWAISRQPKHGGALRDYTPPTVPSRVDGEEIVQTTTQPRMVVASES